MTSPRWRRGALALPLLISLSLTWPSLIDLSLARAGADTPLPPPAPPAAAPPSAAPRSPAPPAATNLGPARPADAILADAIAALGGAAAIGRHRSQHTKMEITFQGLGITGTAEHWGAVGDKALTTTSIPSLAATREGSDGTKLWSEDPINGLRILEGAEAEQARVEVAWNAELRFKELFAKIDAKNEIGDDGTRQECLTLVPKSGPAIVNCFDAKTHLLTVQRGVRSGPQGDMPFTAKFSDWRPVGDIKVAYATSMQVGPLAFVGKLTLVENDVPVDDKMFAMPSVPSGAHNDTGTGKDKGKGKGKGSGSGKARAAPASKKEKPEASTGTPPAPAASPPMAAPSAPATTASPGVPGAPPAKK